MTSDSRHALADALREAYRRGEEDEMFSPLVLTDGKDKPIGRIAGGDAVIFYNIRGEREIELTRSLTEEDFQKFPVAAQMRLKFATMIEYCKGLPVRVAFPPDGIIEDTLSDTIARHGLRQAKITEAEKAVHAGFFLNGKKETLLPGEERIILPTRKDVALFDEAPEMSSEGIVEATLGKIGDPGCPFIFVNLPNVDVVGHIENEQAILRAVECVDECAGRIVEAAIRGGMTAIVGADHGTAEKWLYPDGNIDTGHTDSPVPLIIAGEDPPSILRSGGDLADVAPTVLDLLGLPRPAAMTGRSLIELGPVFQPAGKSNKPAAGRRILLLILDGWGWSGETRGNLIAKARTPRMDALMSAWPHTTLQAAGEAVGLPAGAVGNSEAGHLHIGAGRRIYSDRVKIDRAIADGSFFRNEVFLQTIRSARDSGRALHLLGIVSFFSSHGSIRHLFALMELARREGVRDLYIHAMLGRRGETPESGAHYIGSIEKKTAEIGLGKVVSVIGRYWSMDREENWDRIEKTYRMLVYGEGTPCRERPDP
ncbi:MAG: phosphoglycerate mutase [Syntrophobacterales bacterium RBG_19FT_COMBO_59_10]|nr:MAG: phosphoglycerate mutase [Syntrophobacterales bacterium RBG_19FT_COMBO_59_10]